jgi:hypothetical protein
MEINQNNNEKITLKDVVYELLILRNDLESAINDHRVEPLIMIEIMIGGSAAIYTHAESYLEYLIDKHLENCDKFRDYLLRFCPEEKYRMRLVYDLIELIY